MSNGPHFFIDRADRYVHDPRSGTLTRLVAVTGMLGSADIESRQPMASVILPTYDEALNLPVAVAAVEASLEGQAYEIIIVDDDSPDRTWEIADALAARDGRVRSVRRLSERGLSSAIALGMSLSAGDVLVVMDADLQHDATVIPQLVEAIAEGGFDICVASREVEGGSYGPLSKRRRALSWAGARLAITLLGLRVSDPMSGFFALSHRRYGEVAASINPRGFKILLEILARGPKPTVSEIGYTFGERRHGRSKLNNSIIASGCLALMELTPASRFFRRHEPLPSHERIVSSSESAL